MTCFAKGRSVVAQMSRASVRRATLRSCAQQAVSMPARRRTRAARPRFVGLGSGHAQTTRFTPADTLRIGRTLLTVEA